MDHGSQHTSAPSVAALMGGIMNDVKDLLAQELALATLEVHDTLRKAKTAAVAMGLGIGVIAIGGMLLIFMLVQVLAAYTAIPRRQGQGGDGSTRRRKREGVYVHVCVLWPCFLTRESG